MTRSDLPASAAPDEPDEEEEAPRRESVREAQADAEALGLRADAWLARVWPDLSRARIQGLIGAAKLTCEGQPVRAASDKVRSGLYRLVLPAPEPPAPQPEPIPLAIAYEDEHLIVVNKAAGMAMHPAAGSLTGTLVHALLHHCAQSLSGIGGVARPGIVHRIDKDTTGLVLCAKHDAAHAGLAAQFAKHTIERVYYAVVRGAPSPRNGQIETRLARSGEDRRKMAVVRDPASTAGKHAITLYWTLETYGVIPGESAGRAAAALVECRLRTGRTHQIRAHMAHLGCPLIGDPLYGKNRGLKLSGPEPAAEAARQAADVFSRQALHAAVLGFTHPVTGAALRFEAPLPADMETLLAALRAL